ncbi:MAG: pilus assembly FimT family protein [Desulfovibrionaceae bacterium]
MRTTLPPAAHSVRTGQAGFTLLELMVVMVVMCIAMAVLIPRLGGQLAGGELRSAAMDMGAMAWAARFRAADTGVHHVMVLDRQTGELRLLSADGQEVLSSKRLPDKVKVEDMELEGRRVDGHELRLSKRKNRPTFPTLS